MSTKKLTYHVIVVNGFSGVGKTTFQKVFSEMVMSLRYNTDNTQELIKPTSFSSIQPIIAIMKDLYPTISDRSTESRQLLSKVKRTLEDTTDFTTKHIIKHIRTEIESICSKFPTHTNEYDKIGFLFVDMREPEYINKLLNAIYNKPIEPNSAVRFKTDVKITTLWLSAKDFAPTNTSDSDTSDACHFKYDIVLDVSRNKTPLMSMANLHIKTVELFSYLLSK